MSSTTHRMACTSQADFEDVAPPKRLHTFDSFRTWWPVWLLLVAGSIATFIVSIPAKWPPVSAVDSVSQVREQVGPFAVCATLAGVFVALSHTPASVANSANSKRSYVVRWMIVLAPVSIFAYLVGFSFFLMKAYSASGHMTAANLFAMVVSFAVVALWPALGLFLGELIQHWSAYAVATIVTLVLLFTLPLANAVRTVSVFSPRWGIEEPLAGFELTVNAQVLRLFFFASLIIALVLAAQAHHWNFGGARRKSKRVMEYVASAAAISALGCASGAVLSSPTLFREEEPPRYNCEQEGNVTSCYFADVSWAHSESWEPLLHVVSLYGEPQKKYVVLERGLSTSSVGEDIRSRFAGHDVVEFSAASGIQGIAAGQLVFDTFLDLTGLGKCIKDYPESSSEILSGDIAFSMAAAVAGSLSGHGEVPENITLEGLARYIEENEELIETCQLTENPLER